jgi:hypothetical protein
MDDFTFFEDQSRALDQVRFQLGDTEQATALLSDTAITAGLVRNGDSIVATVADLARGLVAYLAMQPVRESAEGVSVDYSGRLPALQAIIGRMDQHLTNTNGAGAWSIVPRGDSTTRDEYGRMER